MILRGETHNGKRVPLLREKIAILDMYAPTTKLENMLNINW